MKTRPIITAAVALAGKVSTLVFLKSDGDRRIDAIR